MEWPKSRGAETPIKGFGPSIDVLLRPTEHLSYSGKRNLLQASRAAPPQKARPFRADLATIGGFLWSEVLR